MLSFIYGDQSVMSKSAVVASARTGDLILYASAPPAPLVKRASMASKLVSSSKNINRRRSAELTSTTDDDGIDVPTIGLTKDLGSLSCTALLAMMMPAIACSGGERESLRPVDCIGVVIENAGDSEASVLIFDTTRMLILLPLSAIINRPACLRPLMFVGETATVSASGVPISIMKRQALHNFLRSAVEDLCNDRLSTTTIEKLVQSQIHLAAHLLYTTGVIGVPPDQFCAPRNGVVDVEALVGADALYLGQALPRDYAYGNPIWLS